jgi:hypothetical protein
MTKITNLKRSYLTPHSRSFCQHLLERRLGQGLLRHQPLEPLILLLELLELAELGDGQAAILRLPAVERRLRDAVLATDLGLARRALGLLQDRDDLLLAEPLLHAPLLAGA